MVPEIESAQWVADEREVLRENTAQAIHEQLEAQDNLKAKYERRWIWELFQNALDAAGSTENLEIRLRFDDNSFVFSHNGAPFTRKEILHLIFHGSTKRESGGTIGRYGTGFLTTHVISRQLRVRGQLDTGKQFDFLLDRSGQNPSELIGQMEASRMQLLHSISEATVGGPGWTDFEYPLDASAAAIVKCTLSDLSRIAIPVIAFNRKINSIELSGNQQTRFKLLGEETLSETCVLLQVGDPDYQDKTQYLAVTSADDTAIAVPLESTNGTFSVLPLNDTPRLFVAFPLFGTESIPFPFIMNSAGGIPTEERDGLFLGAEDREANLINKSLVEKAWQLYRTIVALSVSKHWLGLHRLGLLGRPPTCEWLDKQWIESVLLGNVTEYIASSALVETCKSGLMSPLNAVFPVAASEEGFSELHSLVDQLSAKPVARLDCAWEWRHNLLGWHDLGVKLSLTEVSLENVMSQVAEMKDVKTLSKAIGDSLDPVDWLNRLLALLIRCGENWNNAAFLPNQMGKFTTVLKLFRDDGIDRELKDTARLLGEGIRKQLLDRRIAPAVQALIHPFDQKKLVVSLLGAVAVRKPGVLAADYVAANVKLMAWVVSNRRTEDVKRYPFMVRAIDKNGVEILAPFSTQLLAPAELWPEAAREFVELFPADHVISSTYVGILTREDWGILIGRRHMPY